MTKITIKNINTGDVIASGEVGNNVEILEGYYYFNKGDVNLENTEIKPSAYHCPIKQSNCDYYFSKDENNRPYSKEFAWIYENVTNSLFKQIESKVGFYGTNGLNNGVKVEIEE